MSALDVPDTPADIVETEIAEHISSVIFDSMEAVEPDCLLCQHAARLGMWAQFVDVDEHGMPLADVPETDIDPADYGTS